MLLSLYIRDFVIVDQLSIHFDKGFTVLTGETGAGKSILIDALGLLLGARAETDMIRAGKEKADISAEFNMPDTQALAAWLAEECLLNDTPGELIVRRVIEASGRSKAFINGIVVPLGKLREVGAWLLDIHGQHAHQSLLREDVQRELLDAYAGAQTLASQTRQAYQAWQEKKRLRLAAEEQAQSSAGERERLSWQINELEALQFNSDEWEDLNQVHHRLHHAASLIEGVQKALALLSEDDNSCQGLLAGAASQLQQLLEYDADGLMETVNGLEACEAELNEAIYALRRYADRLELDPARLAEVENRVQQIWGLARKYRVTPVDLPVRLNEWQNALAALELTSDPVRLQQEEEAAQALYQSRAAELSRQRHTAAAKLSDKITIFMQSMAMQGSRFNVALIPGAAQAYGLENIEYEVASHSGAELRPMVKVASGGELSRIGLALQVAASEVTLVPTLIFDEVDVGIGGRVAEVVGQLLKQLGQKYQVLCITHLPQVAACGDQQLQVSKSQQANEVLSRVEALDQAGRIEEIARMLGGVEITATTREHAAEMLGVSG